MKFIPLHIRLRGPIAAALKEKLNIFNPHALPCIEKVTVNVGINRTKMEGKEMMEYIVASLKQITGQHPSLRAARKSISNFKVRGGAIVGAKVTLRGRKMEDFLDRLIHVALPRVRDFRGIPPQLDGHGNLNIGIFEHSIFPEVTVPDAKKIFGLQITLTTTTDSDMEAMALLRAIGIPFQKEGVGKGEKKHFAASPRS
jgi:large subunit ribosomal protein L5